MPIYEYRCSSCGFQKEYLQKVTDPILTRCPECDKDTFSKLLSAAGFQLKGSGWYATDFKNSGAKKPEATKDKTESKDSGKSDAKDGGKSKETKSEAVSCGAGACPSCS
ncbi:MAG TPA: zinc ribbon domain-containing protein [Burkholderiales bacterium]|nr:zinc ribbon domain-containing protein [Burkholderiales bacterium]